MAASPDKQPWTFDVSSLMVLIGENEESNYRLSRRSLLQCISMVPVVGLQNYIRPYDLLLEPGTLNYFSPYGCKSAPLRNIRLTNAIRHNQLLRDQRYTVYRIPNKTNPQSAASKASARWYSLCLAAWVMFTWILFGGLLVFIILDPDTTWIGSATCGAFTGWSIILRLIERMNIEPGEIPKVTDPDEHDAIYILGRSSAAFILEGTRRDIKRWTAQGLVYKSSGAFGIPPWLWQGFTRVGSLLMLLFIFSVIPNGSTMDQVAFIIQNVLAQLNVFLGQRLNSFCCLSELESVQNLHMETRTHMYAEVVRRFNTVNTNWIEHSGLLPKTDIWDMWRAEIVEAVDCDAKDVYSAIKQRKQYLP